MASEFRDHGDVMAEHIDLEGRTVLDVGCGAGRIARLMTKLGAKVTGIDPGERQLARARAAAPAGDEAYVLGRAENLPVGDRSVDMVVFFNSLHHVPVDHFAGALEEAHRVLKPGGNLYVAEPKPEGEQFQLSRIINDETEVRTLAYQAVLNAGDQGFEPVLETHYQAETVHKNFDAYRENSTAINPKREALFRQHDGELRRTFEQAGRKRADGHHFAQIIRVNLLAKP